MPHSERTDRGADDVPQLVAARDTTALQQVQFRVRCAADYFFLYYLSRDIFEVHKFSPLVVGIRHALHTTLATMGVLAIAALIVSVLIWLLAVGVVVVDMQQLNGLLI